MISRSAAALGVGAALLALVGALYTRHARSAGRAARSAASLETASKQGATVLRVPHTPGTITLDGDTDDQGWTRPPGPAKTGGFLMEDGTQARPYSQARLVWGDEYLYLALYASDEDIESHVDAPDAPVGPDDDHFHVVFTQGDTQYAFDVTPNARITDAIRRGSDAWDPTWNSGLHASREIDGSMNDAHNLDEEWESELAIPLASLGLRGEPGENIGLSLHRCDTPKESRRVCAGWGDGEAGRSAGRIVLQ